MSKQDRQGARTASDLERKYNFGETFAEVMGLADDAKRAAEEAKNAADNANNAVGNLDQEAIFNLLTNNGANQGIYRDENGEIYINASYLKSGIIDASVIQVINLDASQLKAGTIDASVIKVINLAVEALRSVLTNSQLDINGAEINLSTANMGNTFMVKNFEDGCAYIYMTQYDSSGDEIGQGQFGANRVQVGGTWAAPAFGVWANQDGTVSMKVGDRYLNSVSWKDNGDGTYTLIGR